MFSFLHPRVEDLKKAMALDNISGSQKRTAIADFFPFSSTMVPGRGVCSVRGLGLSNFCTSLFGIYVVRYMQTCADMCSLLRAIRST